MRLTLKNVREHASRDFILPDAGLVQLRGPSGAGKTSVLDAVSYALYDNRRGLRTFNRTTCRVELSGFGLEVARGKGPALVRANGYEGEVAQGEIERRLGMSETEFMVSSYLVQDAQGSLLTLPAAEQLRLVQRLACGREDPDDVKARIRALLREQELALGDAEARAGALRILRGEKLRELAALEADLGPDDPAAASRLTEAEARHAACATEGAALRARLADARWTKRLELATVLDEKAELGAVMAGEELSAERARVRELERMVAAAEEAERRRAELATLRARHGGPEHGLDAHLAQLAEACERAAEASREGVKDTERRLAELALAVQARACPACATPLVLLNGVLERASKAPPDAAAQRAAMEKELSAIARALKAEDAKRRALQRDADRARDLERERERGQAPAQPVDSPRWGLTPLQGVDSAGYLSAVGRALASARAAFERDAVRAKAAELLASREARLRKDLGLAGAVSRAEIERERASLTDALAAWETKAREAERERDAARAAQAQQIAREDARKRARTTRSALATLSKSVRELDATLDSLTARHEAMHRLRELSDHAAADAVAEILNTLNLNAHRYLELLFPDAGTAVSLRNEKVLLNGEKRPKLSVEIFHKGARYDGVRDLSGGERSRVSLAFHLAMADMYRSPLLMVDEGLKGLNPDAKDLCLDVLREASRERLVLVVEHGAPESAFDEVIDVA